MADAETIFRVGASVIRVGHALAGFAIVLGACASPATPPTVPAAPDLVIPRLDGDAGAAPAGGEGARFRHPPAAVGDAWMVQLRATSRSLDQVSLYESTYRVEVLAVAGPAPARARLRFLRNVYSFQGSEKPTSIDGKEYVVDARAPNVRDPSGAAAAPDEAERVLDIFPDLGTRARVDEVLPDDALPVGARHDDLAAAILRVLHPRAWTLRTGSATLMRVEGDHAVFEISLDAASENGLRMQVAGVARVDQRDARLAELVLDGRYEVKKGTSDDTAGTFAMRRTVTSEAEARSGR